MKEKTRKILRKSAVILGFIVGISYFLLGQICLYLAPKNDIFAIIIAADWVFNLQTIGVLFCILAAIMEIINHLREKDER